jgi:hypothetical protein
MTCKFRHDSCRYRNSEKAGGFDLRVYARWTCGLVPEKEIVNRYALWNRAECVSWCNDSQTLGTSGFSGPVLGVVIVVVEFQSKRAVFFHDGAVVACYKVPEIEFPLRLGICCQDKITMDIFPIGESHIQDLLKCSGSAQTPTQKLPLKGSRQLLKARSAVIFAFPRPEDRLSQQTKFGVIRDGAAHESKFEVVFDGKPQLCSKDALKAACNQAGFPVACGLERSSHIMCAAN